MQSLFEALRNAGVYDKSHIVVHGDHGSRIATHNLRDWPSYRPDFRPSAETMVDFFETLFAYKPPGAQVGEYKREMVSGPDLFNKASAGQLIDRDIGAPDPVAYLVEWDENCEGSTPDETEGCRLLPFTMPEFSYGNIKIETD
jgi:hypothetical protein